MIKPGAGRPSRQASPRLEEYAATYASYSPQAPATFNAVIDILDRWATEEPLALALLCIDQEGTETDALSIGDLVARSRKAARALMSLGIRKGDRLLIMLPRSAEWYDALLGAIRIGAVPVPAPNLLAPADIEYRLGAADAVAAITDRAGAGKINRIASLPAVFRHLLCFAPGQRTPDGWRDMQRLMDDAGDGDVPAAPTVREDPLLIFFTSGTVGYPKIVCHEQSYAIGHVGTARFWHDLRPGDLHWTVSDTGWAKAAWGSLFGQWHERATVVQVDLQQPEPSRIFRILEKYRITSFCAPPTLYRSLVTASMEGYDFGALRHCTSAGEPLNPEVIRAWRAGTGLTVYEGYGQTETTVVVANFRSVPVRPGSMGKPVPGYQVEIRDEVGGPVPDGEVGNIAILADPHPIGLFRGYGIGAPNQAGRFTNNWYRTGDRGHRDTDGYIWFEARDDDVITSSAYRIGPFEVESALVSHAAIVEAGVVGRPDPQRTEIVCAFVILAAGIVPTPALDEEIKLHVKTVTAPYKYPREIIYVSALPKTVSGKIRRNELRSWLANGPPEGTDHAVMPIRAARQEDGK